MIALIDADFLLYYCTHQRKDAPEITFDSVCNSADSFLEKIFHRVKATEYLAFFSAPPLFRKQANTTYKENRLKLEKPRFFYELKDYLINRWDIKIVSPYEADDLVVIYRNHIKEPTVIVSPDKDLLNLRGYNYNPIKDIEFSITKQQEEEYFWKSMIIGDRADNILGLPGRGPAYAEKFFAEHKDYNRYPTMVFDLYLASLGAHEGIKSFYSNYTSLKILEKPLDVAFEFNTPIKLSNEIPDDESILF